MFKNKKNIAAKLALVIWMVFSILYVLKGEYNRLQNYVAKSAFDRGISTAVTQIIQQSKECRPLPVAAGEIRAELINIECLNSGVQNEVSPEVDSK